MKKHWYKIAGTLLVLYSIIAGFLAEVPGRVGMLDETIRNLFFHVPMWFSMIFLLMISVGAGILYLNRQQMKYDALSHQATHVALVFGVLGLVTGAIWATFTWGKPWTKDPKLNGVAIGMLIYFAYMLLRSSITDPEKRARISAVYNIFAFPIFMVLIFVLPKLTEFSVHPGNGDSAGFATYDLNNDLRKVFYPAVAGWVMLGVWLVSLRTKLRNMELEHEESL